jgi:glycosyltransferase involved in cell wall biosynthesis
MRFYNVQENKIEVVYQSCSPYFYQEKSELEKHQVIEKFQLPKKFILNVSSFHARKNQLELIKAFEKIKGKVEEKLVMVGNTGAMLPMIQSYLAEKKLENDVFILGQVSNKELPAVYQLSSVFVYPSMLEGFGIPILEALFSKIPVVTSAGGCFEEVGGANSSYINPNSADDIADKVLFILNNSKQKEEMITKGIIHAQTMTDKHFAKATMEIYQR